jgi:uncharacterized membrane protein YjfL (UPF0719 family)
MSALRARMNPYLICWIQPPQFFAAGLFQNTPIMVASLGIATIGGVLCFSLAITRGDSLRTMLVWGGMATGVVAMASAIVLSPLYFVFVRL